MCERGLGFEEPDGLEAAGPQEGLERWEDDPIRVQIKPNVQESVFEQRSFEDVEKPLWWALKSRLKAEGSKGSEHRCAKTPQPGSEVGRHSKPCEGKRRGARGLV